MTPEQIDTVTNAAINLHTLLDTYGPGILAGAIPGIGWWAIRRRQQRQARRRAVTQQRLERQQMARLRAAIEAAPLIPTQPGHDQQLLEACWTAWNADTRKEKPQP